MIPYASNSIIQNYKLSKYGYIQNIIYIYFYNCLGHMAYNYSDSLVSFILKVMNKQQGIL